MREENSRSDVVVVGAIISLVILVAAGLTFWRWYDQNLQPVGGSSSATSRVDLSAGMSSEEIAQKLDREGFIRNQWALRLHLRLNNLSNQIQAGTYSLNPHLTTPEIAQVITSGQTATHTVTIVGGQTLGDIRQTLIDSGYPPAEVDAALAQKYQAKILQDKPQNAPLEGYLFPDTYQGRIGGPASELVASMIENTARKLTPNIRRQWRQRGLNVHEGLTLASIVQREVAEPQQQKQAAQVFLKRLNKNMKLEADSTYYYAAEQQDKEPASDIKSPYNTYRHPGLPPTPIGLAEVSALEAVAQPAKTDYLYFVTGGDGKTRFSQTKSEHEAKIEKHGVKQD